MLGVILGFPTTVGVQESFLNYKFIDFMIYMFELDCVHVCIDVWFSNQDSLQVSSELISMYVELCSSHVNP